MSVHSKQEPYRTYVIGMTVPRGSIERSLVWDTLDPYHYARTLRAESNPELGDHDLLIVGGEDHRTGEDTRAEERYRKLEDWTRKYYPQTKEVVYRWSGQVMEPLDGVGLIGRNPGSENIFIITGDSGQGMTHGSLGGRLIADLVLGKDNSWASLYDPSRLRVKATKEYVQGGIAMAKEYAEWLKPEAGSQESLASEEGAVVQEGLKKVAVYRDRNGKISKCSAICPHMGCIVAWNKEEKSFDCPCHGSRYDRYGRVINGPSTEDLSKLEDE